ncbi:E3 ubiquitin-protein ligase TRIM33-like isoform X1 [Rhodnius prolixus]|uniref:E3 ubiquitin-protein ligase TRIM33-like isoform X1 n=1 Tax=Rhodnius prolixus TaxID=13249 RepID=UPI003D18A996
MDKQKREELDEEFIKVVTVCSFCGNSLLENKEAVKGCKLLECLHSICEKCAVGWKSEESYCPQCSLQVHKSKLLDHKILEELVDSEEDPATFRCSMHDTQMATHWCQECADYICERCIENHQQLKVTKDHIYVPKMLHWEHRDKRQGSFPCSIHPSEQLVIFCTKCNIMTCRDCQLAAHREHSYEFVDKVIDQTKMDIYDMYKFLTHHQMVLDQAQELISERKSKILMRKQSLIKEINIFSAALIEIINKRSQNLISRLEQMTSNKVQLFDTNSQALRKHLLPFNHTIQFVKNVLHSSSDPSIMFTKDHILSHMKRIHYQKSTIPNVVRNLQLKFTSGDITNLMKELQSFGLISLNDEDSEGTAIENAATNLGKALRMALTKQFSINNSSGTQSPGQAQSQPQQQTAAQQPQQQHHQQLLQQIPQEKGPPVPPAVQTQQSVPVTTVSPRIVPPDPRPYQWRPQQKVYPASFAVGPPHQRIPGPSREALLPVTSPSVPPPPYSVAVTSPSHSKSKVSWHIPEPLLSPQRPMLSPQAVTINKIRIPSQDTSQKTISTNIVGEATKSPLPLTLDGKNDQLLEKKNICLLKNCRFIIYI